MEIERLLLIISFSIAVFSALFCGILLMMRLFGSKEKFVKRVIILLISCYIVEVIYVLTIFFYNFDKETFIQIKSINFLTMLLLPIMFYHLIFKLTRLRTNEKFSFLHYAAPIILSVVYGVWLTYIPQSILLFMDEKDIRWITGYKIFIFFDYSRFYIRLILSLIYLSLAINRVILYRKEIVQYSSNMEETSLTWIYQIFGILFSVIPFPVIYYFVDIEIYRGFVGLLIPHLLILLLNVTICYHIFKQNFILLTEDILTDKLSEQEKEPRELLLSHEVVSSYMEEKKPYLNPNLKITDLITVFGTNRTYLSSFINTTYGLNFSMYINRYRLEEFKRLKKLPEYKTIEDEELVYLSGFRSYQSFKRSEKILKTYIIDKVV